ncbi:MAG: L,D-transpeptidase [Bdellovibrionota bacterium]
MVQSLRKLSGFLGVSTLLVALLAITSSAEASTGEPELSIDLSQYEVAEPEDDFTFHLEEVDSEYAANQIIRDSYDLAYRIAEGKVDAPSGARLVYRAFNLSAAYTSDRWPEEIRNKSIIIITQDGKPTHAFLTSPGAGAKARPGVYKIHKAIPGWAAPGMYKSLFFHGWPGRENVYAVHGTPSENNKYLGQPASHGCQRIKIENSHVAFDIFEKYGTGYVTIRNSFDDLTDWEKSWLYTDEMADWVADNLR